MNVERLHAVAQAIHDELSTLGVLPQLDRLLNGLQGLSNQPTDAGSQQELSEARSQLQVLHDAPSNAWPASDRQVIEELGVEQILGNDLIDRIEAVLSTHEMTPSVAIQELSPVIDEVRQTEQQLTALIGAFTYFEIDADEPTNDAEISFTIPRAAVHEGLDELGKEFSELWRILAPFQELATGNRSSISVQTISSSAFGLELLAVPAFAYGVARAVNEILSVYKNILEIRESRQRLKESGVPDQALEGIDDYANSAMASRNEALAQELVADLPVASSLDQGRKNELTIEIRLSLNAIANRLDKGYDIDVRAPEPSEDEAEDDEGEVDEPVDTNGDEELQRKIREISPNLRRSQLIGASILSLPESPGEE